MQTVRTIRTGLLAIAISSMLALVSNRANGSCSP